MNLNRKIIKKLLFFVLIFLTWTNHIYAEENKLSSHIMFINQVRGQECCDKGSLDILKNQINKFIETNIAAYFTLRYDVLKNEEYLNYIKTISSNNLNTIKLGLLLEITPEYARDSGIVYHGAKNKWYEAQNIYSIGYTLDENKKMIDTIFGKFYQEFGYYPELTSSWMIETQTLNYIHEKYKVKIHQLTREQWQTDSYTLYGGPPHYPYPASSNWALVPDYDRANAPLIVRQTVEDPVENYGDITNAFTSQPNDYMRDKKTFDYFILLINQAIHQPQKGFALLGLENSMSIEFNDEYLRQIDYIAGLVNEGQVIVPKNDDIIKYWSNQKISVYRGRDLTSKTNDSAYWITTPQYRARLRLHNDNLSLTDFRVFNKNFIDPYTSYPAKKQGFWVAPYMIDGSHGYLPIEKKTPLIEDIVFDVKNDSNLDITSIKLPSLREKSGLKIVYGPDKVSLKYQNVNKDLVNTTFYLNEITVNCPACKEVNYNNHNPKSHPIIYEKRNNGFLLKWIVDNKISHELSFLCNKDECKFLTRSNPAMITDIRIKQYPYLFPEPIDREVSVKNTDILIHNKYAVAGRNPIRIVVIPRDIYNIPIKISEPVNIDSQEQLDLTNSSEGLFYYIDMKESKAKALDITVKIGKIKLKKVKVYFSDDCKKEIKKCLVRPINLLWYINSFFCDKYMKIFLGEKQ